MPPSASDAVELADSPNFGQLTEKPHPTILVVDDRAVNRDFLVSLLNYSGYRTIEAESPAQLPPLQHVNLIITDVHMPEVNGLDFLNTLRANMATRQIPVILYTASYKTPDIESKAKALGAFSVLTKPTAPEVVLKHVRAALDTQLDVGNRALPAPQHASGSAAASSSFLGYRSASLIELMLDLTVERDSEQLIKLFCHGAKQLLRVRQASVHIVVPGNEAAHIAFTTSAAPVSPDQISVSMCECELIELAKITAGRRVIKVAETEPAGVFARHAPFSVLCVPISTAVASLGCLLLGSRLDGESFTGEDERIITTLSSHVAVVYENAILYKRLEQFAAALACEVEDRKHAEEELDRSRKEQIRLKDEFLNHISHELRSPVMVLQQFVEILLEGVAGDLSPQQREYLHIAMRNVHQLNSMIGDLLDATRIETGKLRIDSRSIALEDVLQEAVESAKPAAERKRITISVNLPQVIPLVIADPRRVRQIVSNLVENAIKFTPENGAVGVSAAADEEDSRFIRVQVSDTGCGIPAVEAGNIFDRLYQVPNASAAARKGLGLGLCICKQLVTLQGGQIEVKSDTGRGSTFSFTLPVFSLMNLLSPLLAEGPLPESLVVLSVEISVPEGSGSKHILASFRETIERCVQPDLDVLLPDSYPGRAGRRYVIVARTDERGGQILSHRLESQIRLNPEIAQLPSTPQTRVLPVPLRPVPQGISVAEQRVLVVSQIEESLKAMIAEGN